MRRAKQDLIKTSNMTRPQARDVDRRRKHEKQ